MSELTNCKYRITSKNTNYHLVTDNEVEGTAVTTADGKKPVETHSVLTVTPCIVAPVTDKVTITGAKGLYVALAKDAADGSRLIWSKTKFEWVIRLTGDGSKPPTYQITPHNGKDLYWVNKSGTGKFVIVEAGKKVVAPQHYWIFTKV